MRMHNNDDVTCCNRYLSQLLLMFQTKIISFENIRHILNFQLKFQHSSDTSEIFRHAFKCTFKVSQNCLNWSIAAL